MRHEIKLFDSRTTYSYINPTATVDNGIWNCEFTLEKEIKKIRCPTNRPE